MGFGDPWEDTQIRKATTRPRKVTVRTRPAHMTPTFQRVPSALPSALILAHRMNRGSWRSRTTSSYREAIEQRTAGYQRSEGGAAARGAVLMLAGFESGGSH